ncbi:MAG: hypothetical protein ABSC51_08505 [Gaiellaceae bacterium]|jgi:hypothetical protein
MRKRSFIPKSSALATGLAMAATTMLLVPLASATPKVPTFKDFGPWATTGSNVVFAATIGKRAGLWIEKFGSNTPRRIAPAYCGPGLEEVDQLAVGPKGSVACLEATQGNTEVNFNLAFISSSGAFKHVASAGGPSVEGVPPVDYIPVVFGDSSFLGYLHVTADGLVQLMRISSTGHPQHVADLADVSKPGAVAIDSGHIAITQSGGTVSVYTVAGRHVSSFAAGAASGPSVGIRKDRVVVRTTAHRFGVYTLQGQLVHSYPVRAAGGVTMGLATYAGYVVYIGAGKAVHALKLTTGRDRIIARAGKGSFWSGLSLQAPGAVVPFGTTGGMTLDFIPISKIRAKVG